MVTDIVGNIIWYVYYSVTSKVYSFSSENHLELVLKFINVVYKVGKSMSDDVHVMQHV